MERIDGGWPDTLEARVDVDGFLAYMAGQMILGNMDWPKQNLKYWRYTGTPRDQQPLDGKWHFIMGDSDLGFGANAPASSDMFAQVRDTNALSPGCSCP
ncbi:MAG: CotH kinase family protein [Flavobacteriales bacterium]|nr:CotH kinase family protein [Flavobacteriales bacterium]